MLNSCTIKPNCPAVGSRPVANAGQTIGVWHRRGGCDRSQPYNFAGRSADSSGISCADAMLRRSQKVLCIKKYVICR